MKRLTTLFALLIATTISMTAQTTITGVIGIHSSSTTANANISSGTADLLNLKPITTFTGGIQIDQALDKRLSLSTGIHLRKKGFKVSESTSVNVIGLELGVGASAVTEINYIEVPVMLKLNLANSPYVQPYIAAGPSLSYATKGTLDARANAILDFNVYSTDLNLSSDDYNRTQLGGNAVGGVLIPYGAGHWTAEVGYSHSFTDLVSEDFLVDAGGQHSGWTFSVGYGMRF